MKVVASSKQIMMLFVGLLIACSQGEDVGGMPSGTTRAAYTNAPLQVLEKRPELVFDMKNKLVWHRCLLGQTFKNGRCRGTAKMMGFEEALLAARRFSTEGAPEDQWRLPTVFEANTLLHCPGNAYFDVPEKGLVCCPSKQWESEFKRCHIPESISNHVWQNADAFPNVTDPDFMTSDINQEDFNGSGGLVFSFGPSAPMTGGRWNYMPQTSHVRFVRSPNASDQLDDQSNELSFPDLPD